MKPLRRTGRFLIASAMFSLVAAFRSAAFAQVPPPVPALPDTERRTSYSVTGSTCACSVGFALYGDSTDYQNWVEVYLNGVRVNYNDSTKGWTITSPTGPLATIPRPVTDAVLTFANVQTGTVQIVGARRPRRSILFQENRGVAARDLNQGFNDIFSQNRETWDKINDVTGRALISQPGNTIGPLPLPSACINRFLAFDTTGLQPICAASTSVPPILTGDLAGSILPATTIVAIQGTPITGTTGSGAVMLNTSPTFFGTLTGGAANFSTIGTTGLAQIQSLGINAVGMVGDGVTNNNTAFSAIATSLQNGGMTQLPCGVYKVTGIFTFSMAAGKNAALYGASPGCTELYFSGTSAGLAVSLGSNNTSSFDLRDISITTDDATGVNTGVSITSTAVTGNGGAPNYIINTVFRGHDGYGVTDYWGTGLSLTSVNNLTIDKFAFYGNPTSVGTGISTNSTSATQFEAIVNISHSVFWQCNKGIVYGAYVQGMSLLSDNFTDCNYGVYIPSGLVAAGLDQLAIANSQFANLIDNIYEGTAVQNTQVVNSLFIIEANATGVYFNTAPVLFIATGNVIGGVNSTNTNGFVFNASGGTDNVITGNSFLNLNQALNFVASPSLLVTGNKFDALGVSQGGVASVIAYGNTPEVVYSIALLPTCATAINGVKLVIINGVASPTYHATVGTTGTTWSPVFCSPSAAAWIYD